MGVNAVVALVVAGCAGALGALMAAGLRHASAHRVAVARRDAWAGGGQRDVAPPTPRRWASRRLRRKDTADVERRLASYAEAIARELRAGAAITTAISTAGPLAGGSIARDVERVERRVAGGTDLAHSLSLWSGERASPGLAQLLAVVSIGQELGGELASAFEMFADSLRDQQALHDEIGSLTSQSRASGVLLTALPPLAAVGLAALNPASGRFLVASGAGLACLGTAVVLDVVAWVWMRSLAGSVR